MPIKVEAALVTQKRPHAQFNSDSVNINGKVLSRDIILNGYKGSGIMSGSVYFALTSSPVEGFADAAVAAFNDRAADFSEQAQEPEDVIKEYYVNCSAALEDMNHSGDELAAAVLFASGRKVIVANSGETKLYAVNEEEFKAIEPEFRTDGYGIISFPDVSENDMFILAGPGISDVMSDKDIHDICKIADGSVKKTVSLISKVALAKPGVKAASVIAVKIVEIALDTDKVEAGFVPDLSVFEDKNKDSASEENAEAIKEDAENFTEQADAEENESEEKETEDKAEEKPAEEASDTEKADAEIMKEITEQLDIYVEDMKKEAEDSDEEAEIEEDTPAENKENKKLKKYVPVIITVVAAIAVFLAAFFIVKGINGKTGLPEETTDEFETIGETESESAAEKEETTSEETATFEETTEESTTKKTPVWIPERPERPTSSKVTTTTAAETTSASQQTTSSAENAETTTDNSTTAAAETTTVPAETTDVSTTAAAETTAAETTTSSVSQENSSTAASESSEPGTAAE